MDFTDKNGVDATIICASSKSDDIINSSMELTRKQGRVVIVGYVGLNIPRRIFSTGKSICDTLEHTDPAAITTLMRKAGLTIRLGTSAGPKNATFRSSCGSSNPAESILTP